VTGTDWGRMNASPQVFVLYATGGAPSSCDAPLSPDNSVSKVSVVNPPRNKAFLSRSFNSQISYRRGEGGFSALVRDVELRTVLAHCLKQVLMFSFGYECGQTLSCAHFLSRCMLEMCVSRCYSGDGHWKRLEMWTYKLSPNTNQPCIKQTVVCKTMRTTSKTLTDVAGPQNRFFLW